MNRFQKLSVATTAMTLFLIGVGATVRGTGSGLGCPDWPRCHGKWYPPLNFHSIVEYSHRSSAFLVVCLVVAVAIYAWVRYRSVGSIFWPAFAGLVVIGLQAFIGELVVKSKLNSHLVVLHFATALALLAIVITTTVNAFRPRGGALSPLVKEAIAVAGLTLATAVLGAYVTAWNATLVYADWPLFDGRVLPSFGKPDDVIQWVHRVVAALLGLALVHLFVKVRRSPDMQARRAPRVLAGIGVGLWVLQALAGASQIWTRLADWSVIAHVLGASGLWGCTVALALVAYRLTSPLRPVTAGQGTGEPGLPASSGTGGPGTPSPAVPARPASRSGAAGARIRAYFLLTKPRVVELLLITTVPAMIVAAKGWPSVWLLIATLIGGSLAAGGAGAINCFVDRDIDDLMERTASRPVPAGSIEAPRALAFGILLEIASFGWLVATVNLPAALLAVGATVFYVLIYTMWLKRATPSNIVIGGAAGAAPVLVGWAAVTGRMGIPALVMFAIIYYWTPPHFWALSLRYSDDYAAAGVPMLPVVRGPQATARHIVLYTISLAGVSLVLYPLASLGPIYLVSAVVLGALFIRSSLRLQRNVTVPGGGINAREAMALFHFSIAYLSLLFVAMAADRLIGGGGTPAAYHVVLAVGAVLFAASQGAIGLQALRWRRSAAPGGTLRPRSVLGPVPPAVGHPGAAAEV